MPAWARGFRGRLALVAAGALVIRLLHVLLVAPASSGLEDAFWFAQVSHSLAAGDGFQIFSGSVFGPDLALRSTAEHPPLYPLVLAAAQELGITGDEALRALGAVCGTVTVALVGLLGRRVGGDRVGLLAALIAAVYPLLIAADGALLAETLYAPIVAGMLLAALRVVERPSTGGAALLGILAGLAVLTRSEALLFVPLLIAPVAWLATGQRVRTLVVGCACAALVVTPWVVRNWTTFDQPLLTTNGGGLLVQTNCDAAYHGRDLGYLVPECRSAPRAGEDEAERDDRWRAEGTDYASDHAGRVPVAVAVRALRVWGAWQPFRGAEEQGRSANVQKLGIVVYYALLVPAVYGALALWRDRRRAALLVLLAPVALVTLTAMASYGSLRLRLPADLALIVLAAAGLAAGRLLVQHRSQP